MFTLLTLLFGGLAFIIALALTFGFYIIVCYIFWRVGEKFRTGSFPEYLIPVYNIVLLCRCAGITPWVTLGIAFPTLLAVIIEFFGFGLMPGVSYTASAIFLFSFVYLWGSIAQRLGKNFWLWGILTFLFGGLPIIILAFDGSMPKRGA